MRGNLNIASEQSLLCATREIALLFIFPEDFGGHHQNGPASPWAIEELLQLQGVNDAQRGAGFLCRLSESDCRRPLGFLSNMNTFRRQLYDGRSSFSPSGDNLVYDDPLPKTCPCSFTQKAFKSVTQENGFVSSSASLGTPFWARVLPSISAFIDHPSLRDGNSTASVMPIHAGTSNAFSLATFSLSWSSFYYSWVNGNISRMQLLDYATLEYADKY